MHALDELGDLVAPEKGAGRCRHALGLGGTAPLGVFLDPAGDERWIGAGLERGTRV